MIKNKYLYIAIALTFSSAGAVNATEWITPINGGEIRFDDWGYVGPNGRTALDFSSVNGFGGPAEGNTLDPTGGVGQIQHVVTKHPDDLTPDPMYSFLQEFTNGFLYPDANTDGRVNFYNWGYTTSAGSTFDNMRIDYDGDYMVDRNDMQFNLYTAFDYKNEGVNPLAPADGAYPTTIKFQPYALSNATGWCGSVMASNPASADPMAGQVHFDFGFEVFFPGAATDENGVYIPGTGSMQLIPDFQMRSYGTITLTVSTENGGTTDTTYIANAVVNNTNPTISNVNPATGLKEVGGGDSVDEAWYNQVSFMGAGIIPATIWVLVDENSGVTSTYTGVLQIRNDQVLRLANPNIAEMPTEVIPVGTKWMHHLNSFGNFTFLMRADGLRIVDAVDFTLYNDLTGIPASAYNPDGDLVNLEGTVIQDLGDTDGDGVDNSADNCPVDYNYDQTDLDGDGIGDVCDPDVDGDGVDNSADNCPVTPNTDQSDFDSDGMGDVCDPDADGDGVDNDADSCPVTLIGSIVNSSGCSIAQLCPCAGPRDGAGFWRNHGQYVSCIAHVSSSFKKSGLITGSDQGATVSFAGQSSCGK